jgi:addiction module HigA family antidote
VLKAVVAVVTLPELRALAKELHLSIPRVHEIVREQRSVTADTAIRLARYFGTSAQVWMNLQAEYDIRHAEKKALGVAKIKPRVRAEVAYYD